MLGGDGGAARPPRGGAPPGARGDDSPAATRSASGSPPHPTSNRHPPSGRSASFALMVSAGDQTRASPLLDAERGPAEVVLLELLQELRAREPRTGPGRRACGRERGRWSVRLEVGAGDGDSGPGWRQFASTPAAGAAEGGLDGPGANVGARAAGGSATSCRRISGIRDVAVDLREVAFGAVERHDRAGQVGRLVPAVRMRRARPSRPPDPAGGRSTPRPVAAAPVPGPPGGLRPRTCDDLSGGGRRDVDGETGGARAVRRARQRRPSGAPGTSSATASAVAGCVPGARTPDTPRLETLEGLRMRPRSRLRDTRQPEVDGSAVYRTLGRPRPRWPRRSVPASRQLDVEGVQVDVADLLKQLDSAGSRPGSRADDGVGHPGRLGDGGYATNRVPALRGAVHCRRGCRRTVGAVEAGPVQVGPRSGDATRR